ncbi:peptidoglycan/LPS O-acetylase OafA/YrhL [Sphingomonas sp. BE138]|uniref:acyltransferase family protein n=1 Tax=Sphingomonas sp. BE138 TaxID=2817845 RepID=UPI002858B08C|nr:acyltransferase [Sphingomonas sp. BE138]MDR6788909.1 peptidoglycan/LPS O-acetylase OafA/YrhL [Sphingomonas sp. BE138]
MAAGREGDGAIRSSVARDGTFTSVQMLRAVAALSVVAYHAGVLWRDKTSAAVAYVWENGGAGVDLFFVISGFIILISGQKMGAAAGGPGAGRFLELRLIRLLPVYWLATVLKLAMLAVVPAGVAVNGAPPLSNIIASFFLIPARNAAGDVFPVVVVGWTLSFELLFYVLFAAALKARRDPVRFVVPVLIALTVAGLWRREDWPAPTVLLSPMLLEFAGGMILGRLYLDRRLPVVPAAAAVAMLIAGGVYLAVGPFESWWARAIGFGTAACIVLWAALSLERYCTGPVSAALRFVGETSYSLYLIHGFVLPVVGVVAMKLPLSGVWLGIVIAVASIVGSVIAGIVLHLAFERPVTRALRRVAHDRRDRASLASAKSPL